jgi:hypothetical protein
MTVKVERGAEVAPGIFAYRVASLQIEGKSRQPLLDACRAIKRTGAVPEAEQIAIYREGRTDPDMTCPLWAGAVTTVSEPQRGGVKFVKFSEFDRFVFL